MNPRDPATILNFGKNVRKQRKLKGVTMVELAEKCGVEYTTISKIERGLINTTVSMTAIIAKALDIDAGQLFGSK
jgi:transcriptional regulator with XRE-family HTH domain